MNCWMFQQGSRRNLTDLIMRCCFGMVEFRTDAEVVRETFLLTAIMTAMGTSGSVLSLFDPVQICGHGESLSNSFHPIAHYCVSTA